MNNPTLLTHFRDILLLPFTMTVIIPYLIFNPQRQILPGYEMLFKSVGIVTGLTGFVIFSYTVFLFRLIGKGTLAPWTPTQKLVVAGPYRYCRNPMITGVLFILLGEALFLNSIDLLQWAGLFFLINTTYFIAKEEPDLEKRFGEDYRIYKRNVPRWIPRMRPYNEQ